MSEETFRWVITGGVAIATLCILIMAVVSLMLFRVANKFKTKLDGVLERVEPILDTARRVASDSAPKISAITSSAVEIVANAKDISDVAKDQAHRFAEVGRDVADRTKAQVARVDSAVDNTVEQFHNAGDNMKAAMMKPVREASAVFAGLRAAAYTFTSGRRPTVDHVTQDEELFI